MINFLIGIIFSLTSHSSLALENSDLISLQKFYLGNSFGTHDYIPQKYDLTGKAIGDLNGDNLDDLAIIITRNLDTPKAPLNLKTDSNSDSKTEANSNEASISMEAHYSSPQFVIIFLGTQDKKWKFWMLGSTHFIESSPNQMEKNGFIEISISKKVLKIVSDFAMSAGGWGAGGCIQKWRNEPKGFRLIGLTVSSFHRGCACGVIEDTNYLTGQSIIKSDMGPDGEQLDKEIIKNIKVKSDPTYWTHFNYDTFCTTSKK